MSQKSTYSMSSLSSQKSVALAHNISQLTEKKWSELETNVESLKLPPRSNIRYSYLLEGTLRIAKRRQNSDNKKQKPKISTRHAFLFDGLLILLKRQLASNFTPNSAVSNTPQTKVFKFKQSFELDKFFLNDIDDGSFEFSSSSSSQTGDREMFCFYCNPNEKTRWMSMLCYSKYKVIIFDLFN